MFFLNNFFSKKKLPNLLIIGVQKSATTTLFDLLCQLPEFCGSKDKETGFFVKDAFFNQGIEWYLDQFNSCNHNTIKFEATPEYIYYPDAPKKIHDFNSKMKFIVILREPAERCYSAWNMFRCFNENSAEKIYNEFTKYANPAVRKSIRSLLFADHFPSFAQAVIDDIERYKSKSSDIEPSFVRRGIYHEQIERYLQYFNISDFLFFEQSELLRPDLVLSKIANFINIRIDVVPIKGFTMRNEGIYTPKDESVDEIMPMLKSFYKPLNEKLYAQIGINFNWK